MENKDIALGLLIIAVVGLAGGLGFVIIATPKAPEQPQVTLLWGLPDDWSTAPNASSFILNNGTNQIPISLADILEGVQLAIEEDQDPTGTFINEYKKTIYTYTFLDPISGLYITGVDILDILEKYDTNFAYNLTFTSKKSSDGSIDVIHMSTGDIISKMYEGNEEPVILGLAANKTWLADSLYGNIWGNFSIMGKNMHNSLTNLEEIKVLDSWKVEVRVNGTLEFIIDPTNMTDAEYTDTYTYERDDWWDFNRQYWGRNISEIISHTSATGKNYTLRVWSEDGWASPRPFGGKKEDPYNNTDVELGITPPWVDHDLINDTLVPLPETNLLMNLVYADQEFGETGQGVTDPIWPYRRICGYHRGPFYLIVPGRPRDVYISHVNLIDITVYDGPIP
ncbi:MAG: hypothetical protein ACFE85_00275 [Candidatus Hodarchaeota archaeon]